MHHRNAVAESHNCFQVFLRLRSHFCHSFQERCHFGGLPFHVHMACLGSLCSATSQTHDLSPFQIASMDSLAVERRARYVRLVAEVVEGVEGTGMVYSTFLEALNSL